MAGEQDPGGDHEPESRWQTYPRQGSDATGPQDPDPPEIQLQKAQQRAREAEERAKKAEERVRRSEEKVRRAEAEEDARERRERQRRQKEKARRRRRARALQGYSPDRMEPLETLRRWKLKVAGAALSVVAGIVVAAVLIGSFGDSSSRTGGRFERPATPTPRATEQALRPGQPLTLVTGSRTTAIPDGTGRLLLTPSRRSNSWQIGVVDLRRRELLWSASVVPGSNSSASNYAEAGLNNRYLV